MPKFKVGYDTHWAGAKEEEILDFDTFEEALEYAQAWLEEDCYAFAEEIEEDEEE